MMGGSLRISSSLAGAFALAFSASAVSAQTVEYPKEPSVAEAEQLENEAEAHLADVNRWDKAAKRFRSAALLRPQGDAKAIEDLMMAGKLSYYSGSILRALRDLGHAGERALQEGYIPLAARAFADAAWVAHTGGERDQVRRFAERAQLLIHSPAIDDQLRTELRIRLTTGTEG